MKKIELTSKLERNKSYGFYLPLAEKKAKQVIDKLGKRVRCTLKNQTIHCAILRSSKLGYYIMISQAKQKQLKIKENESIKLSLSADSSDYQMELSKALEEVLESDPEGKLKFELLSPGKQRSLIHYVNKAKHIDTQIRRALKILENVKMGKKDLRELIK